MAVCTFVSVSGSKLVVNVDPTYNATQCKQYSGWYVMGAAEGITYDSLSSSAPYDYVAGAGYWSFAAGLVVLAYWTAKQAGILVSLVRRH